LVDYAVKDVISEATKLAAWHTKKNRDTVYHMKKTLNSKAIKLLETPIENGVIFSKF
jgi:hypothetical protein